MEKINYGRIGIDRAVLKNIDFRQIDTELIGKNFVVMQGNKKHSFRIMRNQSGEELFINYVKISKSKGYIGSFNELIIGAKEILNTINPYEFLDATLPSVLSEKGLNVNNINDVESLKKSLEILERELNQLGFGQVDLKKAQIEELELNINIELERDFKEYERALEYFRGLLPKRLKTKINSPFYPNEVYTGFKVGNDSVSFKIYNKRAQILDDHKEDIGAECLRLEYRLLSAKKIKDTFGHNEVEELLKDFDQVERVFRAQLEKDLINKLGKDIQDQLKNTIKKLKDYKAKYKSKYIAQVVGALGENSLLDYEIFKRAFEIVEEGKNKNTLKNNLTLVRQKLREKEKLNNISYFGNIDKINHLLTALGYEKIGLK